MHDAVSPEELARWDRWFASAPTCTAIARRCPPRGCNEVIRVYVFPRQRAAGAREGGMGGLPRGMHIAEEGDAPAGARGVNAAYR